MDRRTQGSLSVSGRFKKLCSTRYVVNQCSRCDFKLDLGFAGVGSRNKHEVSLAVEHCYIS